MEKLPTEASTSLTETYVSCTPAMKVSMVLEWSNYLEQGVVAANDDGKIGHVGSSASFRRRNTESRTDGSDVGDHGRASLGKEYHESGSDVYEAPRQNKSDNIKVALGFAVVLLLVINIVFIAYFLQPDSGTSEVGSVDAGKDSEYGNYDDYWQ